MIQPPQIVGLRLKPSASQVIQFKPSQERRAGLESYIQKSKGSQSQARNRHVVGKSRVIVGKSRNATKIGVHSQNMLHSIQVQPSDRRQRRTAKAMPTESLVCQFLQAPPIPRPQCRPVRGKHVGLHRRSTTPVTVCQAVYWKVKRRTKTPGLLTEMWSIPLSSL